MDYPKNDVELAAILGTNRRCVQRCREKRPDECPRDRNPESWKKLLKDNHLGPFSAQRGYGEDEEGARESAARNRAKGVGDQANDEIVSARRWENRKSELFAIMEFLDDSYRDGRINLLQYAEIGDETMGHLVAIGKRWEAGIDPAGWRRTFNEILRAEARKAASAADV